MSYPSIDELLVEYDRALAWTDQLWSDLTEGEIKWRPDDDASAIGWHLGHQPTVAHYMVRNLIAAEPRLDADLEYLADSATATQERGAIPDPDHLRGFRTHASSRIRTRLVDVAHGTSGAPEQMALVGQTVLMAVINHEYQHSTWIGEVRSQQLGHNLPEVPESRLISMIDGYPVIDIFK